jgi:hypothetical protein
LIHSGDTRRPVQYARGIRLSNITARQAGPAGGYIMGLPEEPVQGVRLEHCDLEFEGGGDDALAESVVPLKREVYPSCDAFGGLPAYALFMRDVSDVQLTSLTLRTLSPDARPALRWQRVGKLSVREVNEEKP